MSASRQLRTFELLDQFNTDLPSDGHRLALRQVLRAVHTGRTVTTDMLKAANADMPGPWRVHLRATLSGLRTGDGAVALARWLRATHHTTSRKA